MNIGHFSLLAFDRDTGKALAFGVNGQMSALEGNLGLNLLGSLFVDKGGSDTDGNGSSIAPYETITKAMAAVGVTSQLQPWNVRCGPGTYEEPWQFKPGVKIIGSGRDTRIANPSSNWLDESFIGGTTGVKDCGLSDCSLVNSPLNVDFAAVGNTDFGRLFIYNCNQEDGGGINVTGNTDKNRLFLQNVQRIDQQQLPNNGPANVIHNCSFRIAQWWTLLQHVTFLNDANYIMRGFLDIGMNGGQLIFQCTSLTNLLAVDPAAIRTHASNVTDTVITGSGIFLCAKDFSYIVNPPDTDTTYQFNVATANAVPLINGGENFLNCVSNLTGPHTYSILNANQFTRIYLKNQSVFPQTFNLGAVYVLQQNDSVFFIFGQGTWNRIAGTV